MYTLLLLSLLLLLLLLLLSLLLYLLFPRTKVCQHPTKESYEGRKKEEGVVSTIRLFLDSSLVGSSNNCLIPPSHKAAAATLEAMNLAQCGKSNEVPRR
jgi:uncharacterized protein (DUF58 family)